MAKVFDAKPSFAGGELSPALFARIDLAQYQIGAREITNFIVMPQGGILNRPGTEMMSERDEYDAGRGRIRLVPFVFSEEDTCVLVFTDGRLDVYCDEGLEDSIESPYRAEHLERLRWLQSNDVLYLFHNDVPIHTLSRRSDEDNDYVWDFAPVELENGPFEDVNNDDRLTVSFSGEGPVYEMTANFDLFSGVLEDIEGVLFYVETDVKAWSDKLELTSSPEDAPVWTAVKNVFGPFNWRTTGKWYGTIRVQRCRADKWRDRAEDAWEWEDFKTYTSEKDAEENFAFSGSVEEYADHYRFTYNGTSSNVKMTFDYEGGVINRVLKITDIHDERSATLVATDGMSGPINETDAWAVGSFGPHYGYPAMGIFHQERLVLANTRHSPQSIWMSQPASWHNFHTSIPAADDDAIMVTLASKEQNEIRGLASRSDLIILTAGAEWVAKSGQRSDVFTPSSIVITPSGYHGGAFCAPLDVDDVTLFVQRERSVVRSIGYQLDVDGYATSDVSIMARHFMDRNPIRRWAYQQMPWGVVWCVLEDGTCAAVTMQKEHKVTAWTRQVHGDGHFIDVCCVPGWLQDDVWFLVQRGSAVTLERLRRREPELGEAVFMDAGRVPVASAFESLEWEQQVQGTIQGRHKHIPVMTLRLLETVTLRGGIVTENSGEPDGLQFPLEDHPGEHRPPYSGDVRLVAPGGMGRTCRVRLFNDAPSPVTVLGIFPEVVVDEN